MNRLTVCRIIQIVRLATVYAVVTALSAGLAGARAGVDEPRYGWDLWEQRPAAPSNLEIEIVAPNAVRLSWEAGCDRARWFHIIKGRDGIAYVGGDKTEYIHVAGSNFDPGASLTFRVSADNNTYLSNWAKQTVQIPGGIEGEPLGQTPEEFRTLRAFHGHFPGSRTLIFVLDAARDRNEIAEVKEKAVLDGLELHFRVIDLETGEPVVNERVAEPEWMEGEQRFERARWDLLTTEHEVITPELDGIYHVHIDLVRNGEVLHTLSRDEHGQVLQFERRRFFWEEKNLGVTDEIFEPFEPITVFGRAVDLVLRRYHLNDMGFFSSVISRDRELLAGDIELHLRTQDGRQAWDATGGQVVSAEPHELVYEGRAEAPQLRVNTTCTLEYDGMLKVEMTLLPGEGGGEIEGLYLDIPIRKDMAVLQHITYRMVSRRNPARSMRPWAGSNFVPYIWVGEMDRGIAWFANNEKNWIPGGGRTMQEIVVEDDSVHIRVHFINTAAEITEPRTIVFGLQASPTKPMPADYRSPEGDIPPHGGANIYWAMRTWHSCRHPAAPCPTTQDDDPDRDPWHIIDEYDRARRERERIPRDYLDEWLDKRYSTVSGSDRNTYRAHLYNRFNRVPPESPKLIFLGFYTQSIFDTDFRTFWDEWNSRDFREMRRSGEWYRQGKLWRLPEGHGPRATGPRIAAVDSFNSWTAWNVREWYRRGLGIYDDNGFHLGTNVVAGDAFWPGRDRGNNISHSHNIWEFREYNKRNWVLLQQMQDETPFRIMKSHHMTNDMIIPMMSWNDINLDIEWGSHLLFYPDMLRVHAAGRQVGAYPHVHQPLFRPARPRPGSGYTMTREARRQGADPEDHPLDAEGVVRADWAIHFLHDIIRRGDGGHPGLEAIVREAGYGEPDAAVFNYWDENSPVAINDGLVKATAVERDGRWLIVLFSWHEEPVETEMQLQRITIETDAGAPVFAANAESDDLYEIQDGTLMLQLEPYEVRLLQLENARALEARPGPDRRIVLADGAAITQLAGGVKHYGRAPQNVETGWEVVSGNADAVQIADASAPETEAAFSESGRYVLRLTARDGVITASGDLLVTVAER